VLIIWAKDGPAFTSKDFKKFVVRGEFEVDLIWGLVPGDFGG
jgi:hypothetical protein